jgi:hypothetical protein
MSNQLEETIAKINAKHYEGFDWISSNARGTPPPNQLDVSNSNVEVIINDAPMILSMSRPQKNMPPAVHSLRMKLRDAVLELNKEQHVIYLLNQTVLNTGNFVANLRVPQFGVRMSQITNVKTKYMIMSRWIRENYIKEIYKITFRLFLTYEKELTALDNIYRRQMELLTKFQISPISQIQEWIYIIKKDAEYRQYEEELLMIHNVQYLLKENRRAQMNKILKYCASLAAMQTQLVSKVKMVGRGFNLVSEQLDILNNIESIEEPWSKLLEDLKVHEEALKYKFDQIANDQNDLRSALRINDAYFRLLSSNGSFLQLHMRFNNVMQALQRTIEALKDERERVNNRLALQKNFTTGKPLPDSLVTNAQTFDDNTYIITDPEVIALQGEREALIEVIQSNNGLNAAVTQVESSISDGLQNIELITSNVNPVNSTNVTYMLERNQQTIDNLRNVKQDLDDLINQEAMMMVTQANTTKSLSLDMNEAIVNTQRSISSNLLPDYAIIEVALAENNAVNSESVITQFMQRYGTPIRLNSINSSKKLYYTLIQPDGVGQKMENWINLGKELSVGDNNSYKINTESSLYKDNIISQPMKNIIDTGGEIVIKTFENQANSGLNESAYNDLMNEAVKEYEKRHNMKGMFIGNQFGHLPLDVYGVLAEMSGPAAAASMNPNEAVTTVLRDAMDLPSSVSATGQLGSLFDNSNKKGWDFKTI